MINKKYFPKNLEGRFVGSGQWKLIRPFMYHSKIGGTIEVPIDFVSDGASIPRLAQLIIGTPWSGKYAEGAVIHDFLYHKQDRKRKQCDLIFLEAMKVLGVSWWKRKVMFYAVRVGGFVSWRNCAFKKEKQVKKI